MAGTAPFDIFEDRESMLILGEPGAGKTTMLLDIGARLLERARLDDTSQIPIPIYLNLSSFANKKQPIDDWLVERLIEDYYFTKIESQNIVLSKLVLLLDGWDEILESARTTCIQAVNKYQTEHKDQISLIICSRVKEYFAQIERFRVASAIHVKPLTKYQVLDYFQHGNSRIFFFRE